MPHLKHSNNRSRESRIVIGTNDDGIHEEETHCTRQQEIYDKYRIRPTTEC